MKSLKLTNLFKNVIKNSFLCSSSTVAFVLTSGINFNFPLINGAFKLAKSRKKIGRNTEQINVQHFPS